MGLFNRKPKPETTATPAAAWHPDPTGRHQHRYWDGTEWTDHVADDGVASKDPLLSATGAESATQEATTTSTTRQLLQLRRGTGAVSAVGEQYHADELRQVMSLIDDPDHVPVALIPEPNNPHSKTGKSVRVAVVADGKAFTAGYLPSDIGPSYFDVLQPLAEAGMIGYGDGKVRVDDRGQFQVYARLSDDPERLVPPLLDDPEGEFVDGLFDLTVVGEQAHQDVLEMHAYRSYPIAFELEVGWIEKGTHAGLSTFAVLLDGERVGQLTRAMTEKHGPVIDRILEAGRRPYLAGRIEEDHRGYQVILDGPPPAKRG